MHPILKVLIGVVAGLAVGFGGGYWLGQQGKAALRDEAKRATTAAAQAQEACSQEVGAVKERLEKATTELSLGAVREDLLLSLRELHTNNYGNASARLGKARAHLQKVTPRLSGPDKARATALFEKTGQAQTLVMKLDKMAEVTIEELLVELRKVKP